MNEGIVFETDFCYNKANFCHMETTKPIKRVCLHHIALFALLTVAAIAATALIGLTPALADSGLIHLMGVIFVMLAITTDFGLQRLFVDEFRPFLRRLLLALVLLGIAHVAEYVIGFFGAALDVLESLIVVGFYTAAIATMVSAASMLMRLIGRRAELTDTIVFAGFVIPVAATAVGSFLVGRHVPDAAFAPLFVVSILMLALVAVVSADRFSRLGKKFPTLSSLSRCINVAMFGIMLAGFAEAAPFFFGNRLPISESVSEYVSHGIFYVGLIIMLAAFDLPKHFGGIFADLRNLPPEEQRGRLSGDGERRE